MQTVKVLRPFNKTPQGNLADVGETIEVEDIRAQELHRLGLAEPVKTAEKPRTKVAPVPENKQAPMPDNKVAPAPITSEGTAAAARKERSTRRTIVREKL